MKRNKLTLEIRREIQKYIEDGLKIKKIAALVGVYKSTIYRDLKLNNGIYDAEKIQNSHIYGFHPIDYSIIGKKFHKVTVIELVGINKNKIRRTLWKCICDCGRICYFSRKMLIERCSTRRPLSCGCEPKQWKNKDELLPIEERALRKYKDMLKFRKISGSCWEWTGYYYKGKIGKTSWRSKSMSVRKCMYLLMNGITEECNPVWTTCGNLRCFNPTHITLDPPKKRHLWQD